jgi:hypothetical protein
MAILREVQNINENYIKIYKIGGLRMYVQYKMVIMFTKY